jgi:RNA polymerase sigma-70 factor (ECF subfamily)
MTAFTTTFLPDILLPRGIGGKGCPTGYTSAGQRTAAVRLSPTESARPTAGEGTGPGLRDRGAAPMERAGLSAPDSVSGRRSQEASGRESMSEREVDQLLVERAQRGEKHAFELLVAKYQRKLVRLLSRLIRDSAEVEDVAQEAFIKAYRALPSFRGDSAFYTWLYRIGINTAKNHLVAQGRRAPTSTGFDSEDAESFEDGELLRDLNTPESALASRQIIETVNRTLDDLPEELRTAIVLREIDGLSYDEIATAMNCPIGTVRSRIFRARDAIAEKLRPQLGTNKDRRW